MRGAAAPANRRSRCGLDTADRWLLALLAAQTVHLVWWLLTDHTAAMHDDSATHLGNALLAWQALTPPRASSLAACLHLYWSFPYPPLAYLLSVPGQWLFGVHPDACCVVNLVFYNLGLAAVYGIGKRLWSARVGLAAAVATAVGPMLLWQVQQFWVDATVFGLAMAVLYACLAAEGGRRPAWVAAAPLLTALGMLTKWTFLVYVAGPAAILVVQVVRRGSPAARRALLWGVVGGLVLVEPWYVANLRNVVAFAAWNNQQISEDLGTPLRALLHYPRALAEVNLDWPLAAVALAGLVAELRRPRDPGRTMVLAQFAVALVLLTAVTNKNPRYAVPLVPALALWGAAWLDTRPRPKLAYALAALPVLFMLYAGMDGPADGEERMPRVGEFALARFQRHVSAPWDAAAARVADAALTAGAGLPAPVRVAMLKLDGWGMTPMGLRYWLVRADMLSPGYAPEHPRLEPTYDARWGHDLPPDVRALMGLVLVQQSPLTAPLCASLAAEGWTLRGTVPLPDQTTMLIYRRPSP